MIASNSNKPLLWTLQKESFAGFKKERTKLSKRELEVLNLSAAGKSNKQIADMLNINFNTVDSHNRKIVATLGAVNMKNAIAIAFRNKILK